MGVMRVLFFIFFCFFATVDQARAQEVPLPPKARVMLISVGYGVMGGTLLGIASMAFKGNSRTVVKGASLGLYGGIIFGLYVIFGHQYRYLLEDGTDPAPNERNKYPEDVMDIDQYRYGEEFSFSHRPSPDIQIEFFRMTF